MVKCFLHNRKVFSCNFLFSKTCPVYLLPAEQDNLVYFKAELLFDTNTIVYFHILHCVASQRVTYHLNFAVHYQENTKLTNLFYRPTTSQDLNFLSRLPNSSVLQ